MSVSMKIKLLAWLAKRMWLLTVMFFGWAEAVTEYLERTKVKENWQKTK